MGSAQLDYALSNIESFDETEAEWIDQTTELYDFESDIDEILGPDAAESDVEQVYMSFFSNNESDYDGFDDSKIEKEWDEYELEDELHSEGYHIVESAWLL